MKTVPERLEDLGNLYRERNKLYGDNYKHFGKILMGIFPNGIELRTEEQFNRFALFLQVVHKVSRYGKAMPDEGHEDSLDDMAVYSQMLQEWDALTKKQDQVKPLAFTDFVEDLDNLALEIKDVDYPKDSVANLIAHLEILVNKAKANFAPF